jgi:hypothetical protein
MVNVTVYGQMPQTVADREFDLEIREFPSRRAAKRFTNGEQLVYCTYGYSTYPLAVTVLVVDESSDNSTKARLVVVATSGGRN